MNEHDIAWIAENPTPMNLRGFLAALPREAGSPPMGSGRPLSETERHVLERQGNGAERWDWITVGDHFAPEAIRGSLFRGHCYLNLGSGDPGVSASPSGRAGILNSLVEVSTVSAGCLVHNATLRNAFLGEGAVVIHSILGDVVGPTEERFALGLRIEPGVETGGRWLRLHPDLTFPIAAAVVAGAANGEPRAYAELLTALREACPNIDTILGEGAAVEGCGRVAGSIVGAGAQLRAASLIENATLLSTPQQPAICDGGAVVRDAVLQEGVAVQSGAVVERSMLFETVHVERHGKIIESLVAPNTDIAEGEVTASVVGPFVGMHHQSLLIAALWPEGRGNIGYGANIGSNHTSRTADQEIWPGEGTFFGLGSSVKFPANFRAAPYSVIATGATTLPQRVSLPFSLITAPMVDVAGAFPPGINQILPGWGLYANVYALFRNERKYRKRDRAQRHPPTQAIIRFDLVRMLERGAEELAAAMESVRHQQGPDAMFGSATLPGLGKNFVTVADCERGLEAYRRYARFFTLYLQFSEALAAASASGDGKDAASAVAVPAAPAAPQAQPRPLPRSEEIAEYEAAFEEVYADAKRSRSKDITRGRRIIDDYEAVRPTVDSDPVLLWLRDEVGTLASRL